MEGLEGNAREENVPVKIANSDLQELAKWELNGREIKNSAKTVHTWCICKGYEIDLGRLEAGIKVTAPNARKVEESAGGVEGELAFRKRRD